MNPIIKKRSNENLPGAMAMLVSGGAIFVGTMWFDWHFRYRQLVVPDWLILLGAAGVFIGGIVFLLRKEDACPLCGSIFRTASRYYATAHESRLRDSARQQNVTAILNLENVSPSFAATVLKVEFGCCKKCGAVAYVDSRLVGAEPEETTRRQVLDGNAAKQLGAFVIENEDDD